MSVAPILGCLVGGGALLGRELGKQDVEGEIGDACLAGEKMPFGGLDRIGRPHGNTIGVEAGEPVLGHRIALFGGHPEHFRRTLLIDGGAITLEQHHPIFDLGFRDPCLGGLARPFRGFRRYDALLDEK